MEPYQKGVSTVDATGFCILFLAVASLSLACYQVRALYQNSSGLLVVYGKRSFYVCRYTADEFLAPSDSQILDRRGHVFLADRNGIRRLRKRELPTHLSADERRQMEGRFGSYAKICVVRDHKLADRVRQKLAWVDAMRGRWPRFPKPSKRLKDEVIASPV